MYLCSVFLRRIEASERLNTVLSTRSIITSVSSLAPRHRNPTRITSYNESASHVRVSQTSRSKVTATVTSGHSQADSSTSKATEWPRNNLRYAFLGFEGVISDHKRSHNFMKKLCNRGLPRFCGSSANSNEVTNLHESEKCEMLLELHSVCGKEFSGNEKLALIERCHKNGECRHPEFSALLLDLWKSIGKLTQREISIYHKICKELNKDVFSGKSVISPQQLFLLYEKKFLWDLNTLHNHTLSPTLEQYKKKQDLINSLKDTLEKSTNGTLHTFGSCDNGLWVRGSDVDICLKIQNCNSKRHWLSKLHLIRSALSNHDLISSITIISAKVPIAKLYNRENHNFCDISINNTVALDNTRFVKTMAKIDFRVVQLSRFIKYWANSRCINNRSQGTLSSYTLILQLFYFLQNRSPPILPLYKDIETAPTEEDQHQGHFITDIREILEKCTYLGKNTESLTRLLFDFFSFYSSKQFHGGMRGSTIDLYTNELTENNLGVLVVKCPITGKNVNPFTITMWQSIYREFKRVDTYIKEHRPISQICIAASMPPLEAEAATKRAHAQMIKRLVNYVQSTKIHGERPLYKIS